MTTLKLLHMASAKELLLSPSEFSSTRLQKVCHVFQGTLLATLDLLIWYP